MHVHILGLGSVGTLLAHHLRLALPLNDSITLIHKSSRQARDAIARGRVVNVARDGVCMTSHGFKSEVFEKMVVEAETDDDLPPLPPPPPPPPPSSSSSRRAGILTDNSPTSPKISSLFVTTKAHHTLPALQRLVPRLAPHCTIVLMQNGMGIYERLIKHLFKNPTTRPKFILGVNTHGSYLRGMYDVIHAGVGTMEYAVVPDGRMNVDFEQGLFADPSPGESLRGRLEDIPMSAEYISLHNTLSALRSLESSILAPSWVPISSLQLSMMRKLVVNAVVNPLTAIMGCRNGELFRDQGPMSPSHKILKDVCRECEMVYRRQLEAETGEMLRSHPSSPEDMDVGSFPSALDRHALEQECLRVARSTAGNISSMLSDIRSGKPTDIDFVNGYLVGLGIQYNVKMPVTRMLLDLIKLRTLIPLDQML